MGKNAPIDAREAVDNSRNKARSGDTDRAGKCLQFVRECWELDALEPTARKAWQHAKDKHSFKGDVDDIPLGAPVFSIRPDAGPDDAGHVFIAGGYLNGKRLFRGTDMKVYGGVSTFHLDAITDKWGHKVLGWTGDLNGYDLNLPPARSSEK